MKKIKNKILMLLRNKIVAVLIIVATLLFWLLGTFLLVNHVSFSVLTVKTVSSFPNDKILKGNKITGEFLARENNLGIILIPFKTYAKPDYAKEDKIEFKLREKGSEKWYYSSVYRSGGVDGGYFPFGFPIINNSKDKIYQFELVSLNGNPRNAVTVSREDFLSGYQYSKIEIFSNPRNVFNYFINRTVYSAQDVYMILGSILFLLPFTMYILVLLESTKDKRVTKIIKIFLAVLVLANIFIIKESFYGLIALCIILWIWIVIKEKLKSNSTFKLAFTVIFIWILIKFFNINYPQENLNILSFSFLVLGVIQAIIEEKND